MYDVCEEVYFHDRGHFLRLSADDIHLHTRAVLVNEYDEILLCVC